MSNGCIAWDTVNIESNNLSFHSIFKLMNALKLCCVRDFVKQILTVLVTEKYQYIKTDDNVLLCRNYFTIYSFLFVCVCIYFSIAYLYVQIYTHKCVFEIQVSLLGNHLDIQA